MTDKGTSKIVTALLAARKAMGKVHKSSNVTYANKFSYATMEDILNTIEDALADNDLVVTTSVDEVIQQDIRTTAAKKTEYSVRVKLILTLHHISGETLEVVGWGEGQDGGDKGIYAAITGGRKYALCSLFNLATTDDPEKNNHDPGKGPAFPPKQSTAKPSEPIAEDKGKGEGKKESPAGPSGGGLGLADGAKDIIRELDRCLTVKEVEAWLEVPGNKERINQLGAYEKEQVSNHGAALKEYLWFTDTLRGLKTAAEIRKFSVDHKETISNLKGPYQTSYHNLARELKAKL